MQSTITLAMIVKNEAENLKNCLESVHGQVDEIVIVDTGSSDDTLTIARSYTDKVYPFVWRDDFSAARNFAISKASCEWILSLDADEELVMELGNLRSILASDKKIEAYLLPLYNPSSDTGEQYNIFNVLRLFRNNGKYQYSGEIHEQVIITEANCVGLTEGVYIRHKMLPSKERRRKRERNLRLLKKACQKDTRIYCQNPFLQYYLGVEWLILGKPAEALPHLTRAFEGLTDDNILFRAPALRYLVICLHALGKLDQGICLCLDAALKYPEYTDIFYLCGILFEEKKEYELAIKWFSEAIKNGPPPVLYSHMTGTESFLAFYHLGNCYEQIGQAEEAIKCFEQALQANSNYFYPVYTLFLRLSSKFGLKLTQEYLKDKGYLTSPALALAVADLFYTSNNPVLARQSLEAVTLNPSSDPEFRFFLGKYQVYSGHLVEGIKNLNSIPEDCSHYTQAGFHSVIGYLLLGNYPMARACSIKLWKNPLSRCHGHILLSLVHLMEKGENEQNRGKEGKSTFPYQIRGVDVCGVLIELLTDCKHYLSDPVKPIGALIKRLTSSLETLLMNTSDKSCLALLNFYEAKTSELIDSFQVKFGTGWLRP